MEPLHAVPLSTMTSIMKNFTRAIGLAVLAAALTTAAFAQDSYSFKRTNKVGDSAKFKISVDFDMSGMSATYSAAIAEKVVKASDGSYTVESSQSNAKISLSGQEQALPDSDKPSKSTYTTNGLITLIEGDEAGPGSYRLSYMQSLIAPDSPKKVGEKWEADLPANKKTGAVAGKATYEVVGTEKIGAWDTVKVKWTYKETEGTSPATAEGTVWLSVTDFNTVKVDGKYLNAPLPGMEGQVANMNVKLERTS